ncbi:MAG: preprotein translocase subunit SecY [Candidatus Kerfeldbacteria bacterium CG08_land_8_20_14_0_20_43_14]|uniref:Protein translocase subunit SecY n=1 Tax=Candidatus Kerfeldbacteria bacterium CG08_land_8_20_14_0_20_43_14 TaxID=2014246 RepID=A0A2H0YRV6_9BACT|nr:MAG: preprotein translocase subunit SecY [Candidatus Kerfeldbacteria bacterium CG08_land_8_20_14_0_20_43_14]
MLEKLSQLWRVKDLRNTLLFVLLMLLIFRILAHIPVPGVDPSGLKQVLQGNPLLGLLNLFSGGGLQNFSIVMLGVGPYITASIIMQLLTMIIPKLEAMQKEGESGQAKINQYTRYLTVPMTVLQAFSTLTFLKQQGGGKLLGTLSPFQLITAIVCIVGGTMLLMWIGELINEKKVGNGISLIIFAGIVAQVPQSIQQTLSVLDKTQIFTIVTFLVIAAITIAGVVFVTEGQRNIPVTYAKRIMGQQSAGGVNTHLPLRVNQAGVIPIIFAVSIILVPPLIAQFFTKNAIPWIANLATWVNTTFQNQAFYGVAYFVLVVAFTYFYTAVVFQPNNIAENLQKQGGFIPGIRPGQPTSHYLSFVSNRIILGGALFLGAIAVLPTIMQSATNVKSLAIGGTSLLIVVSVVLESVKQVQSQLVMRDYEAFYK